MSLPRLLLGVAAEPMSLDRHLDVHGGLPRVRRQDMLAELERSGLRGRGGASFPLATKLGAVVAAGRRRRPVVVVNGTEGEPMSVKDRMLLECLPHLVLDGAACVADIVGADEIVVAVDEASRQGTEAVRSALHERGDLGVRGGPSVRVLSVPGGYVSGQETAVINFINTGDPRPVMQPPRITDRGVGRRPTALSNVETLAHVALIARHGADWFRELGPRESPGSVLVTLGGGVRAPGVYEIETGSHLGSLIDAAEGLAEPVRAFLFGGYAGNWVDATRARGVRLSNGALSPLRATLGAGVIVALPASACPVAEVARVASWMADEGAGQCGPCANGLNAIADALAEVCAGAARRDAFGDIRRWAELVTARGACGHPDGTARFVTSALGVFSAEFDDHARHGLCDACERRPVLSCPRQRSAVR